MSAPSDPFIVPVVLVGLLLIVDLLLQALLHRTAVPGVVVHLLLGLGMSVVEARAHWLDGDARNAVEFLGSVGIVFLLFRVGLESNAVKLLENLRSASYAWIGSVSVTGSAGFVAAHYGLGFAFVPSLFMAVSLTVTSVGVSVAVWREAGALDTRSGQLLLDVAELDDISGIVFMAVLFALAPLLHEGQSNGLVTAVGWAVGGVLARLAAFALAVALFARYVEPPLSRLIARLEPAPHRLVSVACTGLVVAGAAGGLGFSLAVGAFFAGLAFSTDPEAIRLDVYFDPLYAFFTPFFFVSIGMTLDLASAGAALPLGVLLVLVALAGKLVGAGGGSLIALPVGSAALVGVSLLPCAEVAMVVMKTGRLLGDWAVPDEAFAAMIVVSFLTCLVAPVAIRARLGCADAE